MVHGMRYCLNCGKLVNETDSFCNNCGIPLKKINNNVNNNISNNVNKKSDKEVYNILAIIFSAIYAVSWYIWSVLIRIGNGFSGDGDILTVGDFISVCAISIIFSFIPCILANIFSYFSEKSNLFIFNIIFFIINILLFLSIFILDI